MDLEILYAGKPALIRFVEHLKQKYSQKSDIIDNCESDSADNPLSARQGKDLQEQINNIENNFCIASLSEAQLYINTK